MALVDLLERMRRFRTGPGAPTHLIGVPAAGEALESELGPIFEALDELDRRADAIVDEARQRATAEAASAAADVAAIESRAREQAEREREDEAERRRQETVDACRRLEREARLEADRIRTTGAEQIPALVREVVTCVREGSQ